MRVKCTITGRIEHATKPVADKYGRGYYFQVLRIRKEAILDDYKRIVVPAEEYRVILKGVNPEKMIDWPKKHAAAQITCHTFITSVAQPVNNGIFHKVTFRCIEFELIRAKGKKEESSDNNGRMGQNGTPS